MSWGIPGVSTSKSPQWKNTCISSNADCSAFAQGFLGSKKGHPGTTIHLSQLLLLKSDSTRIRDGIEESSMGSTDLLLPINTMISSVAVADFCCIVIHSVPSGPPTSSCQSKIKRNHDKYSFSALGINTQRYQGSKETWIKTASSAFFL